jgi:hypothetical protein
MEIFGFRSKNFKKTNFDSVFFEQPARDLIKSNYL